MTTNAVEEPHIGNSSNLDRRTFVSGLVAAAVASPVAAQMPAAPAPIPIIDSHIHLFDPLRPQGAPYSGATGQPQRMLPETYRKVAERLGIVGAINIEVSTWIEDNLWALEVAGSDPMMVGVIGFLDPDKSEFGEYLDRFRKNRLFLGIRYGNLWGRDLAKQVGNATFISGVKLLAQAELTLDTVLPNMALLEAIVRLTDQVPNLRVVIDHIPRFRPSEAEMASYRTVLRTLGERTQVYVKISQVVHSSSGPAFLDVASHRDRLDMLIGTFGEDRILFGSDYPNSDAQAPVDRVVGVVKEYFSSKPTSLQEKYYWRNSIAAYRWMRRDPRQPAA